MLIPTSRVVALLVAVSLLTTSAACTPSSDSERDSTGAARQAWVAVPDDAATISQAAEMVAAGGVISVAPGTYPESVTLGTPDVTLRGLDRNRVVITGEGRRPAGIVVIADGVRVENLTVTETTLYGVLFSGVHDGTEVTTPAEHGYETFDPEEFPALQRFRVDHVTATNNGLYGIYAFNAQHGVITNSWASGSADSGIYVGQCRDCDTLVSGNVATRNAIGFENANASDSLSIVGNRFSSNRVGMTLTTSYREAFVPQRANVVAGNLVSNNHEEATPAQAEGAFGIGIGLAGAQQNRLVRNRVVGNPHAGVILSNTEDVPSIGNSLAGNHFADNGVDLANVSGEQAPAQGNCIRGGGNGLSSHPSQLAADCPAGANPAGGPLDAPTQAPPGISFLEVALPGALPSLSTSTATPDPLPDRVTHPSLTEIPMPGPGLLAGLGGDSA